MEGNINNANKKLADRLAEVADNVNKNKADELVDIIIQKIEKSLAEKANQGYYGICISDTKESRIPELFDNSSYKKYLKDRICKKLSEEGFKVLWTPGDTDVREMLEITFNANSTMK